MQTKRKHDIKAENYLDMVAFISLKYINAKNKQRIEDTEEFSDGLLGLTQALNYFDPDRNIKFSTFAYVCIKQSIYKGILKRKKNKIVQCDEQDIPQLVVEYNYDDITVQDVINKLPNKTNLDKRRISIVKDYYLERMTLEQIGQKWGIQKERVRQVREQAIKKLKLHYGEPPKQKKIKKLVG